MYFNISTVRIHIGFCAALILVFALNSEKRELYVIGFAAVLLHELAHLFFMTAFGCRKIGIDVLPGGVRISTAETAALSYRQLSFVYLSGPFVNIILGSSALLLYCDRHYQWAKEAAAINLMLGAMNLLPMSFLDGGRALDNLFSLTWKGPADQTVGRIDRICVCFLVVAGIILLAIRRFYPSFYLFCFYCIIMLSADKK